MPPETWQGAEPSRSAVKRWQRRRQRRRRARNLPPRPQPPSDAVEPSEKVCKLPAGAARTPGHLAGGQAGARGSFPPGCRACATSPAGLPAAGGHTALEGTSLSEGTWLLLRGRKSGEWPGSACVPSCHPQFHARWHHYLFPAAAPSDSCRVCRGAGAVHGCGTSTADFPGNHLNFSQSS